MCINMKNGRKPIFLQVTLVYAIVILHSVTSISAQEVEDEREFDYMEGSGKGPIHWGDLKKEWSACKNGDLQSPIDLSNKRVKLIHKLGDLKRNYKPHNATLKNRGHDISLQWEGNKAGAVLINGTQYFLQQCHWHSTSEHTINGQSYEMELHMVHVNPDPTLKYNIAVVGLLYKIGPPDAFLAKLMGKIKLMSDKRVEMKMGMIDPSEIKMYGIKYYRYMGSLTVPPCTEGVIWTINKKINTVSRKQVELLRTAVHDHAEVNARPLQPVNSRVIHLHHYDQGDTTN